VRTHSTALALSVLSFGASGCSNLANTNAPFPVPGTAVTIDIVGINGSQSFSPNPATIPAGQLVVWHNVDSFAHRVVLDNRSIDTGNLDPGAFSSSVLLKATGAYHCTIHPEMVGTINGQ
jgi:plastocyanin